MLWALAFGWSAVGAGNVEAVGAGAFSVETSQVAAEFEYVQWTA
jgi:hypothetical protein